MEITTSMTVGELAARHPATIRVFQRRGIDFCCGGNRPILDASQSAGTPFEVLRAELDAAVAAPSADGRDWTSAPLDALTAHIVQRYHDTLREELPRVAAMMAKVLGVHGERHPELAEISRTFAAIHDDLLPHMMKEERVLFPYVGRMQQLAHSGGVLPGSPFGTVANPIATMEEEHDAVADGLRALRRLTSGFEPPADGCNTFRGLYHAFAELERELQEHIHLENNVLFPRAVDTERTLASQVATH